MKQLMKILAAAAHLGISAMAANARDKVIRLGRMAWEDMKPISCQRRRAPLASFQHSGLLMLGDQAPLIRSLEFLLDPAQPRIAGIETRNTLQRLAKVVLRASAKLTGSPSSSAEGG
ncbi:hypothetical protein SAMN04487972_1392 [Paracoccus halophilus]|uniref:Uncharacterized protein n=1 Tax=Paracoccus halophilus TaxID=376733 RepID=A0A099EVG3_9RHOB|nr:hypothetical protein IT41_18065 [Paracoccus halophilus]SFA61668.1 hypothetical protein SAMN04487972_1392 [Paracoccus halophilus]